MEELQVAKIEEVLALFILGTLSIDGVRYFNPRQDELGNWIMDLQMAIDNFLPHEIIIFDSTYFELLERASNGGDKEIIGEL